MHECELVSLDSRSYDLYVFRYADALGIPFKTTAVSIPKGNNLIRLPIADLGPRSYVDEARISGERRVTRFVKQ